MCKWVYINTNNLFRKFLNYAEKFKKTRYKKYTGVNRKNDPFTGTKYEGQTVYTTLQTKSRKSFTYIRKWKGMRCNGSKFFKELHVQSRIRKTRHFHKIIHEPSYMFHKIKTKETRWKTYTHKSRKHWDLQITLLSNRTRHNQVEGY